MATVPTPPKGVTVLLPAATPPSECETLEESRSEAEAMLRVANAIARELPNVKTEHWRGALERTAGHMARAAERRLDRPSLELTIGGAA